MKNRIEELCNRPIIADRDLTKKPITPEEILDCLLLTAALDTENAAPIEQGMEALAACAPERLDACCMEGIVEFLRLSDELEEAQAECTDSLDLDDRLPEVAAACQALRFVALLHPQYAEALNIAAEIMEEWWTPFELEE